MAIDHMSRWTGHLKPAIPDGREGTLEEYVDLEATMSKATRATLTNHGHHTVANRLHLEDP